MHFWRESRLTSELRAWQRRITAWGQGLRTSDVDVLPGETIPERVCLLKTIWHHIFHMGLKEADVGKKKKAKGRKVTVLMKGDLLWFLGGNSRLW